MAKLNGKWQSFGNEEAERKESENRARNQELDNMVARGEAEYTYDNEGMISGVKTVKKNTNKNIFGAMYDQME